MIDASITSSPCSEYENWSLWHLAEEFAHTGPSNALIIKLRISFGELETKLLPRIPEKDNTHPIVEWEDSQREQTRSRQLQELENVYFQFEQHCFYFWTHRRSAVADSKGTPTYRSVLVPHIPGLWPRDADHKTRHEAQSRAGQHTRTHFSCRPAGMQPRWDLRRLLRLLYNVLKTRHLVKDVKTLELHFSCRQ